MKCEQYLVRRKPKQDRMEKKKTGDTLSGVALVMVFLFPLFFFVLKSRRCLSSFKQVRLCMLCVCVCVSASPCRRHYPCFPRFPFFLFFNLHHTSTTSRAKAQTEHTDYSPAETDIYTPHIFRPYSFFSFCCYVSFYCLLFRFWIFSFFPLYTGTGHDDGHYSARSTSTFLEA